MLKTVAVGSNEPLIVDVSDRTGGLTSITGQKHEVYNVTTPGWKVGDGTYAGASASTSAGLSIISQINHASWAPGTYALYVWFTVSGSNVRKGPFYYTVVA